MRIFHHKTGEVVLQPLEEDGRPLYPELETNFAALPRLGFVIVMNPGHRGQPALYTMNYAAASVRKAWARPAYPIMSRSMHAGMGGRTELGDAELAIALTAVIFVCNRW